MGQNHNPPWGDIHMFNHRTSTGTCATLHTFVKIFAADVFDFLYEFFIIGFIRDFDSQWSTSLLFEIVKYKQRLAVARAIKNNKRGFSGQEKYYML
jgi:hypothetical protein